MLSLTELLKAIDKFYVLADRRYPISKRAKLLVQSPTYDQVSENIFDSLSNEGFAKLFEKYLKTYENLVNSLQISPQEFAKIVNGGETKEDNFADLLEPFQDTYHELIDSPYLQQDIQGEGWEESSSPQEITAGIEALAKDAMDRIYALGKSAGISEASVRNLIGNRRNLFDAEVQGKSEQFGLGGGQEGAGEGMTAQEQEYRNRKIHKAREAGQEYRKKRSESLAGYGELVRQVEELQKAIPQETNGIKREEMTKRLNDALSRLKTVDNYRRRQNEQLAKLKSNPETYAKYVKENNKRKIDFHNLTFQIRDLITALGEAKSPNDQARIKAQMVRLKKDMMQRKNPQLDFDSDAIRYNTKIQEELNPDNIIRQFSRRLEQRAGHWQKHHQKNKQNRAEGNLEGLLTDFNRSIAFDKNEVKKKLNKLFLNDPIVKPFQDKLVGAKRTGDEAAVAAALSAYDAFLKSDQFTQAKEAHPTFQAVIKMETAMRDWRFKVKDINKSGVLDKEVVPENAVAAIRSVIAEGRSLISTYTRNASLNKMMNDIVNFLEDRIS